MLSAKDVAEWFIHWAASEEDSSDLTNMKLQKLLYYAQGHHLGKYGVPLFGDQIEAWSHGPVVRCVYGDYKDAGSGPVQSIRDNFDWDEFSEYSDFLSAVWNSYGGFTAARLRNMSHAETPWKDVFRDDEPYKSIPRENISKYFSTLYSN